MMITVMDKDLNENEYEKRNYPHFYDIRFPFFSTVILFAKEIANLVVALLFPTVASLSALQSVRSDFSYHTIMSLILLLFIGLDYYMYRKKSFRAWRIFEWTGAIITIVLSVVCFLISDFTAWRNDYSVNTEQYSRWETLLAEKELSVGRCVDNHSLLETQSWTTSAFSDSRVGQPEVNLFFAVCIAERFAQNYRLQFLKDHKDDEIQQYIEDGITYITVREKKLDASFRLSAMLIKQKTVIIFSVDGKERNVNELVDSFLPVLHKLFEGE